MGVAKIDPQAHDIAASILRTEVRKLQNLRDEWVEKNSMPKDVIGTVDHTLGIVKNTIELLEGKQNIEIGEIS